MKRIFSWIIILSMVFSTFPMPALATTVDSGTCGDNLTWELDSYGTLTISGTGPMNDYGDFDAPWLSYRNGLLTAVIEEGVTGIGKSAFYMCHSLTSVTIPDSVTTIGAGAFHSCDSLTSVMIPDSVTYIGALSFGYCSNLDGIWVDAGNANYSSDDDGILFNKEKTELLQAPGALSGTYTIPDSVTSIGNYAFLACASLTSVTIPDSVTSIGFDAFHSCDSLTSVTIPNSVTYIGTSAFGSCGNLNGIWVDAGNANYSSDASGILFDKEKTKLLQAPGAMSGSYAIPDSVASIGNSAFSHCYRLTSITIPDSVTGIGDFAFEVCNSLTSVTIPDGVTSIAYSAFSGCTSLTSVTIPDSVTSIGAFAFEVCNSLTSVTIPDSVTDIGDYAFYYCSSLSDVYFGGTEAQWAAISIGTGNTELTSARIHYNGAATEYDVYVAGIGLRDGDTLREDATDTLSGYSDDNCVFYQDGVLFMYNFDYSGVNSYKNAMIYSDKRLSIHLIGENNLSNPELTGIYGAESVNIVFNSGSLTINGDVGISAGKNVDIGEDIYTDGSGSVVINGAVGIDAGDSVAVQNGNIAITATLEGISAPVVSIEGGTVDVNSSQLGIYGADTSSIFSTDGEINISGGSVTVEVAEWGTSLASYSDITISGGDVNVAGDFAGIKSYYGDVNITGGYVTVNSVDQSICAEEGNVNISGGTVNATAENFGVYVPDGDVTVTGGTVDVISTDNYPGREDNHWAIYASGAFSIGSGMAISGAFDADSVLGPYSAELHDDFDRIRIFSYTPDYDDPAEPEPTEPAPSEPTEPSEPGVPVEGEVFRLSGANRYATGFAIADQLKATLGVDKFQAVVVAYGQNFPDALTGSYLAAVKNAPILLTETSQDQSVLTYLEQNLAPRGTVYILGGTAAVSENFENGARNRGFTVSRLKGAGRYETNLAILNEAGVNATDEILIATGKSYADSLSASATGLPMLLVDNTLTASQKAFLKGTSKKFVILGGTGAVSAEIEAELDAIGEVSRVKGSNRYSTSVTIAQRYFGGAESVVLAYGKQFPDGLCGGPLALSMGAPLILTSYSNRTVADNYVVGIRSGAVCGGTSRLSDFTVRDIFDLPDDTPIVKP